MTRVLDLGMREGHGDFDAEYFKYEYTRFEEAYYCSDIVYESHRAFTWHRNSSAICDCPTTRNNDSAS